MAHCCIIGGAGFIGSHLVDSLIVSGMDVTVIGRRVKPVRTLPNGVRYLAGDFGDRTFLTRALQGVDKIVNLAYSSVPKSSFEDPVEDIISNLPSAVTLFEVASSLSIEKLVTVSSGGTVYGRALNIPISEDHPTNPISPYGITKLAIEKYAQMFNHLSNLPVICVRPANAYGEGQKPFVGQGFIATAIASILLEKEITLFGENGTIRDYIYVTDVVQGIIAALQHGTPGSSYNIGSGIGRSNQDVINAIRPFAQSRGLKTKVKVLPPRDFDVPENILDNTKITTETGWKPKVSFAKGIEKTWKWVVNTGTIKE